MQLQDIAVNGEARRAMINRCVSGGADGSSSVSSSSSGRKTRLNQKAGKTLGFDLASSLAAIDQWVAEVDSEGSGDETSEVSRPGSQMQMGLQKEEEVLSRAKILSMCHNSSGSGSQTGGTNEGFEDDFDDFSDEDVPSTAPKQRPALHTESSSPYLPSKKLLSKKQQPMTIALTSPNKV